MAARVLAAATEEEPSVLLPASYDIIWSTVCFLIILVFFWKWVLPQLRKALDERTAGIEVKLEQAERDRAEAQQLLARYREQLAEARSDAARIRTEAQADRKSIVEEARVEAQQEAERVHERSRVQLEAELGQARSQLSRDVGRLAVDLAEKVVGANLSDTERTRRTVDAFLDELEATADSTPATTGAGGPAGSGGSAPRPEDAGGLG